MVLEAAVSTGRKELWKWETHSYLYGQMCKVNVPVGDVSYLSVLYERQQL